MTQIRVDNNVTELSKDSNQSSKVGDLIKNVHSTLPNSRMITKVFLDGNQISTNEKAMEESVENFQELEIQTADKLIWAQTGLDIALSCLERVQSSFIRTAELLREPDKARANRFFAQCIDGLERFLESVTITRFALNLNFDLIKVENHSLSQTEVALSQILKSLLDSQEKSNFEELADKIDYELITNLSSWKSALTEIRLTRESNS